MAKKNTEKQKGGYVYLICDLEHPYIYKIGVTTGNDVNDRRDELQTGNASELHVCQYFKSKFPFLLESHLHRLYNSKHKHGEWFELTDKEALEFTKHCRRLEEDLSFVMEENYFMGGKKRRGSK